jgi:hypothetical protein
MGYDLARRLHGLIERLDGTNTYILTDDNGQRVAIFLHQGARPTAAATAGR